jgi:hypothetical protein
LSNSVATFTPAMVGNLIHLTSGSGATAGWYTVTGYTDSKDVNVNTSPGTGNTWTAYIGGALAAFDNINSASAGLGYVAGNTIWLTGSTSYSTTTVTTAVSGTLALPFAIRGYKNWRGDAHIARPNANGVLPTTNMFTMSFTTGTITEPNDWWVDGIYFTSTRSTASGFSWGGTDTKITNCTFTNSGANQNTLIFNAGGYHLLENCDVLSTNSGASSTSGGLWLNASGTSIVRGCRIVVSSTSTGAYGIGTGSSEIGIVEKTQIIGAGYGEGVYHGSTAGWTYLDDDTISNWTDGVAIVASTTHIIPVIGCMITETTDAAFLIGTSDSVLSINNRFNHNGTNGITASATSGGWVGSLNIGQYNQNGVLLSTQPGTAFSDYNSSSDLRLVSGSPAVGANYPPPSSIGANQASAASAGVSCSGTSQ